MNEDDMAARHIEPNSLVEMESLTEGSNVAPTAGGFNSRPYNVSAGLVRRLLSGDESCKC
jgi:hypothetical protein